jgi:hypothetical protein
VLPGYFARFDLGSTSGHVRITKFFLSRTSSPTFAECNARKNIRCPLRLQASSGDCSRCRSGQSTPALLRVHQGQSVRDWPFRQPKAGVSTREARLILLASTPRFPRVQLRHIVETRDKVSDKMAKRIPITLFYWLYQTYPIPQSMWFVFVAQTFR